MSNKENHHGNLSETASNPPSPAPAHLQAKSKEVKSCFLRYVRFVCIGARVRLHVCVRLHVHAWDLGLGCLGMSHCGSMFPFSSGGTLAFLLADLFSSCEVPVMCSLFLKVTDLSAEANCTI